MRRREFILLPLRLFRYALCVALIEIATPARAEVITLNCKVEKSPGPDQSNLFLGDHMKNLTAVDQIVIDTSAPEIKLNVARTIGTENPIQFKFKNDAYGVGKPNLIAKCGAFNFSQHDSSGKKMISASFFCGAVDSFFYNEGMGKFHYASTAAFGTAAWSWRCER